MSVPIEFEFGDIYIRTNNKKTEIEAFPSVDHEDECEEDWAITAELRGPLTKPRIFVPGIFVGRRSMARTLIKELLKLDDCKKALAFISKIKKKLPDDATLNFEVVANKNFTGVVAQPDPVYTLVDPDEEPDEDDK